MLLSFIGRRNQILLSSSASKQTHQQQRHILTLKKHQHQNLPPSPSSSNRYQQQQQQEEDKSFINLYRQMPKSRTKTTANNIKTKVVASALAASSDPVQQQQGKQLQQQTAAMMMPKNWSPMYNAVVRSRAAVYSVVDVIGCHMLADRMNADPETQRFQTLVSLMLSAQTRDQCTAAAVRKLMADIKGGLTIPSIAKATEDAIRNCINMTCFYNNKAKYIKETAIVCMKEHDGKVPRDLKELLKLPGVGHKMANIFKECADGEITGIGVDVHMHRIMRKWKWTDPNKCKTPDDTMRAVQAWLPRPYWKNINEVLVGFGQLTCKAVNPHCESCLARHWCPAAETSKTQKANEKDLVTNAKKRALQDIEDTANLKHKTSDARQKLVDEYGEPRNGDVAWLAPSEDDPGDGSKSKMIHSQWFVADDDDSCSRSKSSSKTKK